MRVERVKLHTSACVRQAQRETYPAPLARCRQNLMWRSGANEPLIHVSSVAIQYEPAPLPTAGVENETSSTRVGSMGVSPMLETRFDGETSSSSVCVSSEGE